MSERVCVAQTQLGTLSYNMRGSALVHPDGDGAARGDRCHCSLGGRERVNMDVQHIPEFNTNTCANWCFHRYTPVHTEMQINSLLLPVLAETHREMFAGLICTNSQTHTHTHIKSYSVQDMTSSGLQARAAFLGTRRSKVCCGIRGGSMVRWSWPFPQAPNTQRNARRTLQSVFVPQSAVRTEWDGVLMCVLR